MCVKIRRPKGFSSHLGRTEHKTACIQALLIGHRRHREALQKALTILLRNCTHKPLKHPSIPLHQSHSHQAPLCVCVCVPSVGSCSTFGLHVRAKLPRLFKNTHISGGWPMASAAAVLRKHIVQRKRAGTKHARAGMHDLRCTLQNTKYGSVAAALGFCVCRRHLLAPAVLMPSSISFFRA